MKLNDIRLNDYSLDQSVDLCRALFEDIKDDIEE
jgi:hypothetical protein